MQNDDDDPLENNLTDDLVAVGRAAVAAIPLIGGAVGELLTRGIPNQRTDRVVAYIRTLEARLSKLEKEQVQQALSDPEKIDLIEEGAFQSARATSAERIERIAALVANGLKSDTADIVRRKRLALLLRELDDDELLLLNAYGQSYGGPSDIWETIDVPPSYYLWKRDRTRRCQ